jgi:hypothetical protein
LPGPGTASTLDQSRLRFARGSTGQAMPRVFSGSLVSSARLRTRAPPWLMGAVTQRAPS